MARASALPPRLRQVLPSTRLVGILQAFPERHIPALRALVAGLIGLDDLADARIDLVVRELDDHLAETSAVLRFGLLFALDVLRFMPLLVLGRFSLLENLDAASRATLLQRLDRSSRLGLPLVAYKTLVTIAFYEIPGELEALGYTHERRRHLLGVAS